MSIKASIAHGALAVAQFFIFGLVLSLLPLWYSAAFAVALWWLSRELAQSFRPNAPTKLVWSVQSTVDVAIPLAVVIVLAAIMEII
jgi:hypothetical protein